MSASTDVVKLYYRVNKDGYAKPLPKLKTVNTSVQSRLETFLKIYGHEYLQRVNNSKNIKPEVIACISRADSHLGYALKSKNNVGNVGNTDSGKIVEFETLDAGIRAIAATLNGTYLKNKQTIGDLSFAGSCTIDCDKVYATSNQNWQNNLLNCLSLIHKEQIQPNFTFRK